MKKYVALFMVTLLFTGCSPSANKVSSSSAVLSSSQSTETENESNDEGSFLYSNLFDKTSQKEITDALESHGVSKEQISTFIEWVNDFNSRVKENHLPEGFATMGEKGAKYDGVIVDYRETEDGEVIPEVNCRLSTYLLMKNMIETNGKEIDNDTFLMFDTEAIDTYDQFKLSDEEKTKFVSFFNWVPVNGTSTLEEHKAKIEEAWKDREIKISGDGISIINVYLHSPFDEVRFVGHTGVLMETDDGLLFVEKYGPMFPFQATKFNTREELKTYLLNRADFYGDDTELEPIVMENDKVI